MILVLNTCSISQAGKTLQEGLLFSQDKALQEGLHGQHQALGFCDLFACQNINITNSLHSLTNDLLLALLSAV